MKHLNAVLSTCLSLGLAMPAVAAPWTHSVTVKASDYSSSSPGGVSVYVVAPGQTLRLTDVVMTHNVSSTTSTFRANLRRGPASNITPCATASPFLSPFVGPLETVSLNLTSPIVLQAGEQLCIVIGGAFGSDGVSFNLVGETLP